MSENQTTIDGEVTSEMSGNMVAAVGNLTGKPKFNQATSNGGESADGRGREKYGADSGVRCVHCHRNGHTKISCWFLQPHLRRANKKGRISEFPHKAAAQRTDSAMNNSDAHNCANR